MPENKSFLESISDGGKPESFSGEKFVEARNSGRNMKIIIAAVIIVALIAGYFGISGLMNKVEVPELVGKTLAEVSEWAQRNKIVLYTKSVYSFNDEEGMILNQDIAAGASVDRNSAISLQVSGGPDPEETVEFPDIKNMSAGAIEEWIDANKLTGAKLEAANSDVVENGHVISYTFTDGSEDNFKRKNRVTITLSLGPAELSETVIVSDFSSMRPGAILQWGAENGVEIKIEEDFDEYIAAGSVISQSVKKSAEIKRTDGVTVVVSLGKPVKVPDFSSMTKDEANSWARSNNVSVTLLEKFSNSSGKGSFISQSAAPWSSMKEGDEIKVCYSLGKVDVASFIGRTKLDILSWQYDVNSKGAGIVVNFSEAYGEKGTAGKIISQSVKNDYVSTGTSISIVVSKGMRLLTPDFSGLTEAECVNSGKDAGLSVLFDYQYSNSIAKGCAVSQIPAKDTVITDADTVIVVIALSRPGAGTIAVADFSSMKAGAISQWGIDNGIQVFLVENYNNFIPAGGIISQSVAKNMLINKTDSIIVNISKGPPPASAVIPSLSAMSRDEANAWARSCDVALTILEKYSNGYAKGALYGQTIPAGGIVYAGGTVKVYYSLGKVDVGSFIGKTRIDVMNWQGTVNEKGAGIILGFTEGFGAKGTAGKIIGQSVVNEFVDTGSTINVVISKGMKIVTPDFDGKTETECGDICEGLGLAVVFEYEDSGSVAEGHVIRQSIIKDTIITDADAIIITIEI